MKNFYWILILCYVLQGCNKDTSTGGTLLVEGYLFANKPFDTIRIAETVSEDLLFSSLPVVGAKAVIKTTDKIFKLVDLPGRPGIYYYPGSDFTIMPSTTYQLEISYKKYFLTAETSIMPGSSAPVLSKDTIFVSDSLTTENINHSNVTLTWQNDNAYSLIVSKYQEKDTIPMNSSSFQNKYIPYYLQRPFQGHIITMHSYDFRYYGKYQINVYQVQEEYFNLFEELDGWKSHVSIQKNMKGGSGIFTGIYADSVGLVVFKKQ